MPPAGPLAHLRVVELTDLRGAFAGRLLADLGADVCKVEPRSGDAGRLPPPFAGDVVAPDRSLPFHPEMGEEHHSGNPLRFGRLPLTGSGPAPCLGEHTAAVLAEWLALPDGEVAALQASGVCR